LETNNLVPKPEECIMPCVPDTPDRAYLAVSRGYSFAIDDRKYVVQKAKAYLSWRQRQSDVGSAIVICVFCVGWTAHLAGSMVGIKMDSAE
jgi:hypothetical protein